MLVSMKLINKIQEMVEVEHEIIIYKGIYIWNHTGNYMVAIGALSMLFVKENTELYMLIIILATDIALVTAGVFGFTFIKKK